MKNQKKWKKLIALMTAVLMILAAMPVSLAAQPDWQDLTITVHWYDADQTTYRRRQNPFRRRTGASVCLCRPM